MHARRAQGEGVGARVRRSIGTAMLRNFDPFLMLDEFMVQVHSITRALTHSLIHSLAHSLTHARMHARRRRPASQIILIAASRR